MANRVITISRGFGSGGRTIGKLLAQRLDIDYYNDDLITLQQVNDIIENEIQNRTCVDRYMLRYFLKYLSGAINEVTPKSWTD